MAVIKCHHIGDLGVCDRPAQWQLYIGNGDASVYLCGVHLNKGAKKIHDERACRIVGRTMHLRFVDWEAR